MASNKKTPEIEDSGERLIPELHDDKIIYGEHMGRYTAIEPSVKDKVVLDIACGSGYGSQLLAKTAKKVYGVDIDDGAVKYAQKHYPAKNLEYLVGSGTSIPLEDSSVDMVVSMETIEHIEDQETFLSEVKRILKPGGNLFVSTPNDKEYPKGNHFHVREHNKRSLEKLLKAYFKHVEFYYQTDEVAATIIAESRLGKRFTSTNWQLTKNIPLTDNKCIYFLVSCSDSKPQVVQENTMLAEFYSYHEVARQWNRERELWLYTQELEGKVKQVEAEKDMYAEELRALRNSRVVRAGKYAWRAKEKTRSVLKGIRKSAGK